MGIMKMARKAAARPTYKDLRAENERLRTALDGIANWSVGFNDAISRARAALRHSSCPKDSEP